MPLRKGAKRILLALTLCASCAIDAYGSTYTSLVPVSTGERGKVMTFVIWIAIGLAAGVIGNGLVKNPGVSVLPDILLSVAGAVAGGWLFYTFGSPGVNGLHVLSLGAAVIGSLVILLIYYGFRQLK
jgi:uncharacterized membrane protein YeaQ/YmgE (transglycosylase-associated protein family)